MAKRRKPDSDSDSDDASSSSSEEAETPAKVASEYEKQRMSRIAENKARLEALGLPKIASSLKGIASSKNKGKKKVEEEEDDGDDDEEYRPNEEEPASDSSSQDDESDKDEDFVVGNATRSRKKKQVKSKGLKIKAKVTGKKHCNSNSEYVDDDDDEDEALRQAIALSLQDTAENSSEKHVVNIAKAEKKGNINIQEDKGRKNKKSFASRLQMTEDELIVHFFQLDEAGKGTVSVRDIQRAAIAHDFVWTDKELAAMICCFDSDGDGKLSFDDFKKIVVRCNMIKES